MFKTVTLLLIGSVIVLAQPLQSFAQGTAFTYQGQLTAVGVPASGNYDFVFSLCDASNAGNYIGFSVTNDAVAVTNGLFNVQLDFGQVFDGSARWLEIGVRTNGASAFTTLAPRQQLTPAPYAITAGNALTASTITGPLPNAGLSGSYTGQITFNNPSNAFSGAFYGNGGPLTNDLRALAVYVNSNYTVSASETAAMQTTNIIYYLDTTAGNLLFTFPAPPAPAGATFTIVNFGTNTITLTNQPGSMFETASGYSGVDTNEVTVGGYFDKVLVWQNFNGTNWVQLASHRTEQEIRDIAAAYVGFANGVGDNLTINSNLIVNGTISGNGTGLTNLNAQNVTGTLSETALPSSAVLTNGASAAGQVPTWNGSNYVWAPVAAGDVYSNTAVTFSSINTTNTAGPNALNGTFYFNSPQLTNSSTNIIIGGAYPYEIGNLSYYTQPIAMLRPLFPLNEMIVDIMPNAGTNYGKFTTNAWVDICNSDYYTNYSTTGAAYGQWLHLAVDQNGDGYIEPDAPSGGNFGSLFLCAGSPNSQLFFGANFDIKLYQAQPAIGEDPGGSLLGSYGNNMSFFAGATAGKGIGIYYSDTDGIGQNGNRQALWVTNNLTGYYSTLTLMKSGGQVSVGGNETVSSNLTINACLLLQTNAMCPNPLSTGGWLWNSNNALYWVTTSNTNYIAGP